MKIVAIVARYLLALGFLVFGMNIYMHYIPTGPLPPGDAGQFLGVLMSSRFVNVVGLFEVVPAILLIFNRYVPLALALLAPVLFNIIVFHLLMAPSGLPIAAIFVVLWFLVFYPVRFAFSGLLQKQS